MSYEAVLFDYDGITADTPELNHLAWAHAFEQHGVKIGKEEYFLLEGHGPLKVAEALCRAHAVELTHAAHLKTEKEAYMRTLRSPAIYPEIPTLLQELSDRNIKIGLVTGAARARLEFSMPASLRELYGVIVTSDDVVNTKPHPEPYLTAASCLEVKPENTLVVENALLGIQSALQGGFNCAAITTTLPAAILVGAKPIFSTHHDFVVWISEQYARH